MIERDFGAARKFAIKWAIKSKAEIANLGGAYLQLEFHLAEMLDLWYCPIDDPGCPDCVKVRALRKLVGLPEEKT